MKTLRTILMLGLGAALAGCSTTSSTTSQVNITDVRPAPAAALVDGKIQIVFGNDIAAPKCWIHPGSRTEGGTVYIYAHHNTDWATHAFQVDVPSSVKLDDVKVVWVNPDGSNAPVPLATE